MYLFTKVVSAPIPSSRIIIKSSLVCLVTHGSDLPYLFGGYYEPSPSDVKLGEMMRDYWISFVVSQHPNDGIGSESTFSFLHVFWSRSRSFTLLR
jgi:hypothetical protein